MQSPDCIICSIQFDKMENLNNHMQKQHKESDNDRLNRLTLTIQTSLDNNISVKDLSCTECGVMFKTKEEQESHIKRYHCRETVSDKVKDKAEFICELCDRVFTNQVVMSNHKLFLHTVKTDKMKCDYCGQICDSLKTMCKHISSKHNELFPKRLTRDNQCNMCYKTFTSSREVIEHMDKKHSPDSFYEKLKEEISGKCCKCGEGVSK